MEFLWTTRYPAMTRWLARGTERASFQRAVLDYVPPRVRDQQHAAGAAARDQLERLAHAA